MAGHNKRRGPARPAKAAGVDEKTFPLLRHQAVRMLGVKDRTFARLEAEGVIKATTPGTGRRPSEYDAYTLVPAYLAYRELKITGSNEAPRDRKDRSQAELNELKLARERQLLLPRDQVVREGTAFIKAVAATARALPARLLRAELIDEGDVPAVTEFVREMQEGMSLWQTPLDLLGALEDED